jgi:general secretion pathway protein D
LTAGNRSGNAATPPNSIDGLLRGNRVADPGKKAPAITALSGVLTDPQFQVVLRGLNQRKGVDLASSPEVIAKSGQKAKVEILREFIYPTEFEPPEIPQDFGGGNINIDIGLGGQITGISSTGGGAGGAFPVVPTTPTAFEMVELGHSLEVEATVGADNRTIELSILPSFKEFEGFINYGTPITTVQGNERIVLTENRIPQPVFRANQVSGVNVTVWSGNTIVIAGLAGDERTTIEDKTPVLGDLPFVGRFFRTKAESVRTKAVIFLVTAEVVDPSGETPPAAAAATAGN